MKFNVFLLALVAILGMVAAASTAAEQAPNQAAVVKTPAETLEKLQASALPDGVTLTGTTEKIDPPASAIAAAKEAADDKDGKKEQFGWGLGGFGLGGWGLGGWGNWGGWGGFGPYRFGFRCGGIPGWAYLEPLRCRSLRRWLRSRHPGRRALLLLRLVIC